jgi:hypothetical protein
MYIISNNKINNYFSFLFIFYFCYLVHDGPLHFFSLDALSVGCEFAYPSNAPQLPNTIDDARITMRRTNKNQVPFNIL